jgi:hypothetical protein
MPTSQPDNLTPVCRWLVQQEKPERVLDIGVGCGKWGVLVREYVDYWGVSHLSERHTVIDGIEAFAPYVGDLHRAVYDNLFIGDALDVLPTLGHYDIGLAIDVLEHIDSSQTGAFLACCKTKISKTLVVVPRENFPQDAWGGNEYERHRSEWSEEKLAAYGKTWVVGEARFVLIEAEPSSI